jgi:spermidine synthase
VTETWITEHLVDFYRTSLLYQEMLLDEHTDYQHIQIVKTDFFGNVLLLDGVIQLTELDNAGYHEMIVHIPMLAHNNPKRVLIVGGGDGGTLQQVLRYATIEQVVVCELDRRVVEVCTQFFPNFGRPFDHSRVRLVIGDAFEYLECTDRKFDVIIADTTDPIGEAEKLFTAEFYELMVKALTDNGVITAQCEQMYFNALLIKRMMEIAKGLVQHPAYYHTLVPTYPGGGIGFLYMSDAHWQKGLGKPYPGEMSYLNRDVHKAAFALPEFFREFLE